MNLIKKSILLSLASAATLLSPLAFAASTWTFSAGSGCSEAATNSGNYANSFSCSAGAGNPTATGTAWANTGSGSTFAAANLAQYGTSGFGVRNTVEGLSVTPPDHSMDNATNLDLMELSFSSAVTLKQLTLGWTQNDSDVSVLRYTGSTAPTVTGKTTATLLSSGWQLVGSYSNIGTATTSINASNLSSSWWLISAYSSSFGGTALDSSSDYIKVLSVAGTTSQPATSVPEPASLALVGAALFGMFGLSRRKQAGLKSDADALAAVA